MKFACSMGFSDMADQTVSPPSLSRDRKYTHSLVVPLRLESKLVIDNSNNNFFSKYFRCLASPLKSVIFSPMSVCLQPVCRVGLK